MSTNLKQYLRNKNISGMGNRSVILTENYQIPYLGTNNMNTIVISSVGTGKTRGFLKSNLLQKGCSFVITDTKGDLFNEFAWYLQNKVEGSDEQYVIKLVNFKNPQWSNHYNPFQYMHTEEDVVSFALSLSMNVNKNPEDSFWLHMATNLIASMCFFVFETCAPHERNIGALLNVFNSYLKQKDADRYSETNCYQTMIDLLPTTSMAKKFFLKCECSDRTWSNAVATVGQALSVFEYTKMLNLMSDDDLELEEIGNKKTAIFINLDDTNPCYDFIAGLLYTQIFNVLYHQADKNDNYQLKEHVRFFMDDFANYKIPNISHILSTCRSRGISIEMILQSEAQLKCLYGYEANNLIANCAYIYIGSNDLETQSNIAQRLNKTTKDIQESVDKTYVFFPEGVTIVDNKADYLKHNLYNLLYHSLRSHESLVGECDNAQYDLWSKEWNDEYGNNQWVKTAIHHEYDTTIKSIITRDDNFDSDEERILYNTLMTNSDFTKLELECAVHMDLRDIFDLSNITNKNIKYKLMLMHCDFVLKSNNKIVAIIEVDGTQHSSDINQAKNDIIKDTLFSQNRIHVIRIPATDIRNDSMVVCDNITKQLSNIINSDNNYDFSNCSDLEKEIDRLIDLSNN